MPIKYYKMVFKNHLIRDVGVLFGSAAISYLIFIAFFPILCRLYSPKDFGVLAAFTSILGFLTPLLSGRYELALPLARNNQTAINLLATCLIILCCVTCAIFIVAYCEGQEALEFFNLDPLSDYLWILVPAIFLVGLFEVLRYWMIRERLFSILGQVKLIQGTTLTFIPIAMSIVFHGPIGLILGDVFGRAAGIMRLLGITIRSNSALLLGISLTNLGRVIVRYKNFPLLSTIASGFNSAVGHGPPLYFFYLFGAQEAGFFIVASRVIGMPITLVSQAVSQVYLGEGATRILQNMDQLKTLYSQIAIRLLSIGLPATLLIVIFSPKAFELILGEEWTISGRYAQIMSLIFLSKFVVQPLTPTLNMIEKQNWQLLWDACRFIAIFGAMSTSYSLAPEPAYVVFSYSITLFSFYLIDVRICWRLLSTGSDTIVTKCGKMIRDV